MQSIVESAPKPKKRGNPYRDANGRLTSKENAVYDIRANPYHDKAGKFASKIAAAEGDESRAALSKVERRIIKKPNICEQCRLNDDPAKVPVHPHCDCDVVTDSIESGVADPESRFMKALHRSDVLMEMFGEADIPETLQLDPVTTAIMDGDSVRFSDLARWLESMQPYLERGAQFLSIVVDDDTPEAAQQVSEAVSSIAENIENLPEAIRNKKLWFALAKSVIF